MSVDVNISDLSVDADLEGLTVPIQTSWRSEADKDEWRSFLSGNDVNIRRLVEFHEMVSDEVDRKAMMMNLHHGNRHEWAQLLAEHELYYKPVWDFAQQEGSMIRDFDRVDDDPERISYVAVSPDEEIAEKLRDIEQDGEPDKKHKNIGVYLGFPQCCIDGFNKTDFHGYTSASEEEFSRAIKADSARKVSENPLTIKIDNSPDLTHRAWWNMAGLLTHIPHSWNCEATREIIEWRCDFLSSQGYGEWVEKYRDWNTKPFVWETVNGIVTVQNEHVKVVRKGYPYTDNLRIEVGEIE